MVNRMGGLLGKGHGKRQKDLEGTPDLHNRGRKRWQLYLEGNTQNFSHLQHKCKVCFILVIVEAFSTHAP